MGTACATSGNAFPNAILSIAWQCECMTTRAITRIDPIGHGTRASTRIFRNNQEDPTFAIFGSSRYVVFARIGGELRCYTGRLRADVDHGARIGNDPARLAAVAAEPDVNEVSVFVTVSEAFEFTVEYLIGTPLPRVSGARRRVRAAVSQG
jgi:hypothetical protein